MIGTNLQNQFLSAFRRALSGHLSLPATLALLGSLVHPAYASDMLVTTLDDGFPAIEQLSLEGDAQSLPGSGVLPGGVAFDGLEASYVFDLQTGLVYPFDLETGRPGAAITTRAIAGFSGIVGTSNGLLVASNSGEAELHAINTSSGSVEQLCAGSLFAPISALAMEGDDAVLIASSFTGEIYSLDLVTCTSTIVSSGYFVNPVNIVRGTDGDIFVIDHYAASGYGENGSIFRVDRASSAVSAVAGPGFTDPRQLAVGPDGRLLVLDATGVFSVDTQTGDQHLVYAGSFALADTVDLDLLPQPLDDDGVADIIDNCPTISNADQQDSNQDGFGDACVPPAMTIPEYADIHPTAVIGDGKMNLKHLVLESGVVLGDGITARAGVSVGKDTVIGDGVLLGKGVVIGSGVRIGNNVRLGRGVTIKDGAIIGDDRQIASGACISSRPSDCGAGV